MLVSEPCIIATISRRTTVNDQTKGGGASLPVIKRKPCEGDECGRWRS
nr:MAG TPA: hypothetical protein [Caudoviricetes sp.]